MIIKMIKLRDILSKRISDFGGEKAPPAKYGRVEIWMGEELLKIKAISGGSILSHINIEVEKYK